MAVVLSRRARRVATIAGVALVVVAVAARHTPPPPRGFAVSFLDVGQGDATLLQDGRRAVLVDTGPPGSPVVERLRAAGVTRLDALVVTHAQLDHDGGATAVLRAFPVGLIVDGRDGVRSATADALGAAAVHERVRRVVPDAGVVVRAGRLELRVLWPSREPAAAHAGEDPNRRAIVAVARLGHLRVFLPADAESDVTGALDLPPVDILKVAHHGSADPGLEPLLARLRPRIAVIEVGRHNRYGHPTAPTLAALRAVPHVYRTDRDGTVRVTPAAGALRVSTED